jgi:hypothetical protein
MTIAIIILTVLLVFYVIGLLNGCNNLLDIIITIIILVSINNYKSDMEAKQKDLKVHLAATQAVNGLYKSLLSDNNLILVEGE